METKINPFAPKAKLTIKSTSISIEQFAGCLMTMAVVLHKHHLKVTGVGSYAAHKALNSLYDALPGYADSFIETYQGYYGKLLTNYTSMDEAPYLAMTPLEAVTWLLKYVEDSRTIFGSNSMLQNKVDELLAEISSAKYKLTFLS